MWYFLFVLVMFWSGLFCPHKMSSECSLFSIFCKNLYKIGVISPVLQMKTSRESPSYLPQCHHSRWELEPTSSGPMANTSYIIILWLIPSKRPSSVIMALFAAMSHIALQRDSWVLPSPTVSRLFIAGIVTFLLNLYSLEICLAHRK